MAIYNIWQQTFPLNMVMFHNYVSLPQGTFHFFLQEVLATERGAWPWSALQVPRVSYDEVG